MNDNKLKLKLPNGITIICYEEINTNKSSGNVRKFLKLDLKDGREYLHSFYKCIELNGKEFEGSWKY